MSRWLSDDVISMPLGQIEAEIAAIKTKPDADRTVLDVERLRDLLDARQRITGGRHRRGYC
jgi:hypothetical protein